MQWQELINRVSRLPPDPQEEVLDFIAFLEYRYGKHEMPDQSDWSDNEFQAMSVEQAMKGLEDEPELYSEEDLKERWQ